MNEKEIKKGLRSDVVLSEQVEAKIQAAYQKVRKESMAKKESSITVQMRHRKRRRMLAIAAAATLTLGTTLGVVASNKYFTLTQNDDEVLCTFNLEEYELCGDIFEIEPTYLPEGYENNSGKYHKDGDKPGTWSGITPVVENTASWVSRNNGIEEIWGVDDVETTTINGMETYIFKIKESHGVYYNRIIQVNSEEGYIVTLYTTGDISIEEAKKIAEGLKVTNTGEKEDLYDFNDMKLNLSELNDMKDQMQIIAYNVGQDGATQADAAAQSGEDSQKTVYGAENMLDMHEKFTRGEGQIEFSVESARYVESSSGYDTKYFMNYEEEVLPYLNEDGTVKPHWRLPIHEGENPDSNEEEQAEQVFLEVKMHAKNISDQEVYTGFYFETQSLVKDGEQYTIPETTYYNVADFISNEFQVYFDGKENFGGIEESHQGLWRTMQPEEELDFTMLMLVDKDQMDQTYLKITEDNNDAMQRFVDLGLAE